MEAFYKLMYRMRRITASQIWDKVDSGELIKDQAVRICGPRPKFKSA